MVFGVRREGLPFKILSLTLADEKARKARKNLRPSVNEPPRSKLRGIKAEFAEANPPSLFKLRRVRPAIHTCSKLQGILAKANKAHIRYTLTI